MCQKTGPNRGVSAIELTWWRYEGRIGGTQQKRLYKSRKILRVEEFSRSSRWNRYSRCLKGLERKSLLLLLSFNSSTILHLRIAYNQGNPLEPTFKRKGKYLQSQPLIDVSLKDGNLLTFTRVWLEALVIQPSADHIKRCHEYTHCQATQRWWEERAQHRPVLHWLWTEWNKWLTYN